MIEVAKIVKPQGIKGELKAMPLTNLLQVFDGLKSCTIDGKERKIKTISFRQGFLYLTIEGIVDRNGAELLRNKDICVEKELLHRYVGEEFLIDDLIGMVLYDLQGQLVGQIEDVVDYGSGDVLIINCGGRTIEAPYVNSAFLRQGDKLVVDRVKFDEVAI